MRTAEFSKMLIKIHRWHQPPALLPRWDMRMVTHHSWLYSWLYRCIAAAVTEADALSPFLV